MKFEKAEVVIVSDIHLLEVDDERGRLLCHAIDKMCHHELDYFILLGDIFDFCLGSHVYYKRKYAKLGEALSRLARSGTRVLYMEGNHEFRLADFAWPGVEFVEKLTHQVQLRSGPVLQLGHGDMIYSHNRYKNFRRLVKSKWFTQLATYLPGRFMDYLATRSAAVSRSHDQYRTIDHGRILNAAYDWLEDGCGDYGVFGHFHVPYAEARRDGRPGGVLSSDCWDQPSFLIFQQGRFFRSWLSENQEWQLNEVRSYFLDAPEEAPKTMTLHGGASIWSALQQTRS